MSNNIKKDYPLKNIIDMKTDKDGVRLDKNNEVQCTSCHDPHNDSNRQSSGVPFWRKDTWSGVCFVCHE